MEADGAVAEAGAGIQRRQRPSSAPVIIRAATVECAMARTGTSAWPLPWPSASSACRSAFRLSQLHSEPERSSGCSTARSTYANYYNKLVQNCVAHNLN